MRKRVAVLLTIVMLLSSISTMSVSAAPAAFDTKYNYMLVSNQGLLDGENGIEINNNGLSANEAGVKWDMKQSGTYTLSYYVEQSSVTNKVELKFNVDAAKRVKLAAKVTNTLTAALPIYSYKQYQSGSWKWETTTPATGVFEYDNLYLDSLGSTIGFEQQQLSLQAGALPIRMMIKGQTIHISTEGVEEGNITEFKLQYDSGLSIEEGSLKTIKGLKNFRVSPTHLTTSGSFTSKELLKSGEEELGSHPGIKVEFDKPKVVQSDNFTAVTGSNIKAVLNMWVSTSATGGSNVDSSNGITLKFDFGGSQIKDEMGVPNGEVQTSGNTMSIYVNKPLADLDLGSKVVKWDKLDSSMLVGVGLTLEGDVIDELPSEQKQFNLENNGHTYMQYAVFRASESQVGIRIIPYNVNGAVTYTLKQGATQSSLVKAIDHYYPNRKDSTEPIYIYIPNIGSEQFYQLEADIGAGETLKSQIMQFQISNETAPPTVPRIQNINNIYAVPSDEIGGQPQAVGFDIEWQAPPKDELDLLLSKGTIYYELSLHKTQKENRTSEDSAVIKIFKVSKETNGTIKVETVAGTAGSGRYISASETFAVEGVVVKDIKKTNWERIQVNDNRFTGYDYPAATPAAMEAYSVPGVYYTSINAIFDPDASTKKIAQSQDSSDASVPIDNVNLIIPVPTDLKSINRSTVTETEQAIQYDIEAEKVNIQEYVEKMLSPAELYLNNTTATASYKGTYEMFLYQKNDKKLVYTDQDLEKAMATTGTAITLNSEGTLTLDQGQLNGLRNGGIIPIVYPVDSLEGQVDRITVSIENLDPNQVYYVKLRVRLNPFKNLEPISPRYSIFSKTLSFTTTSLPKPPNPEDKVPPVPEDFWVDSQPNNTTAVLKWAEAKLESDEDTEKVYYEIARVVDTQFKESERSNKLDIEKLITLNSNIVGFNTSGANLMTIDSSTAATGWQQLQPLQASDAFKLEDANLSPNTIYYYYIRTVCVIDGTAVRSEWIMVPVTTHPVERPIKLQVEATSKYAYDPKTETVISFLAPIKDGAVIPDQYEFEIAVQSEMEDAYRLDYSRSALTSKEDSSHITTGYRHFVYKLYDLKPGKRYDIKVRIVDKTKAKSENAEYPRSLYSDKAVARTEFDQDDQDKDDKFEEYLKQYDDAAEKLRRMPFWEVEGENRLSAAYKYRKAYINAEMAAQNTYELQTSEGMNKLTYYLPASMLDEASDFNVVIQSVLGNESMHLRPYTLTAENEDIKEAVSELNQKEIDDYYIKLDFVKMTAASQINREKVISPEICIDMDLVYLESEDMLIEDDIMVELNNLIDKERKDIITLLEDELEDGKIDDETLQDIIDDAIQDIREDHQEEVRDIIKHETDKTVSVSEIEKPILITSILESSSVNGYYLEGSWSSVEVVQANGGFTIEAQRLGIYAFTGSEGISSTLPELAMYQSIISKYNLADFFVLDAYMIKTGATKRQVYGVTARILGAKRNTDYALYLKSKGIKGITNVGADKVIRQDEAIYILMQAYEKVYNKPITAINIKNKQSITNIGAFQPQYRNYVYAAVELKVIQNPNAKVLPSKSMSAEEMIQMLSKIAPR